MYYVAPKNLLQGHIIVVNKAVEAQSLIVFQRFSLAWH